ncbi:GPP34 family phosphoprotein [Streptomyces cocklensis]|uniref:Golgi phosphoprotein 3 (GPP34) n=1 Tax=Actinacidiphila cocklensis TaxID=887465 RepID=A0A9W4DSL7_9ACTN|nr:GPP34 family phosphoprotein [Actinacidiphila cocklensis]MDD1062285.1 GPP34 family phosphoprotein [Actinacidiphila cocklensis]CAG6395461.1 Golgi phosphoprotein 3 (GPP34) [Actinacidiphila cocklensis]
MGDELLLLAIVPGRRRIRIRAEDRLRFALRAAELAELSLAGRIAVGPRRIEVLDSRRVDVPRLSNILHGLDTATVPPSPQSWLRGTPRSLTTEYLSRLEDQKTVRVRRQRVRSGSTRHDILSVDLPRRQAVLDRLGRVVFGGVEDARDLTLLVLAQTAGIAAALYPGLHGSAARRRTAALAATDPLPGLADATRTADEELATTIAAATGDLSCRLGGELRSLYSDTTTGGHSLGHDLSSSTWSEGHTGGSHHHDSGGGHGDW